MTAKKKEQSEGLQAKFKNEIVPRLKEALKIKNSEAVPRLSKVTINVGIGSYVKKHNKDYSNIVENIAKVGGQKPVEKKAKKSVSNFKVREGEVIGVCVTLRGKRMYDLISKLVNVVFPRVRDFRGISPKSFDGSGNYSIGFKEHVVFPEISPDDIMNLHGIEINITTTASNNEEGFALLKELGFPFKK